MVEWLEAYFWNSTLVPIFVVVVVGFKYLWTPVARLSGTNCLPDFKPCFICLFVCLENGDDDISDDIRYYSGGVRSAYLKHAKNKGSVTVHAIAITSPKLSTLRPTILLIDKVLWPLFLLWQGLYFPLQKSISISLRLSLTILRSAEMNLEKTPHFLSSRKAQNGH